VSCLVFAGCDSSRKHVAQVKKLVKVAATPATAPAGDGGNSQPIDLRGSDVESERYLPVRERQQRRQKLVLDTLARLGPKALP
jgi:hypothetical protein